MATRDQIEELKQLTAGLEKVAEAEEAAAEAKAAYRDDPTEENKQAHREASQKLAETRAEVRSNDSLRAVAPGDVSITPPSVSNAPSDEK